MRHIFTCLLILGLSFTTQAQQEVPDPWPEKLVGRWEGAVGMGTYKEEWHKVDDRTYEGKATMAMNGKVASTERMRLFLFADQWLFIAATGGPNITSFVRTAAEKGTWRFENREHDFPKRVGYTLKGDTLAAWIDDGTDAGKRMDFFLQRMK